MDCLKSTVNLIRINIKEQIITAFLITVFSGKVLQVQHVTAPHKALQCTNLPSGGALAPLVDTEALPLWPQRQ